MSFIAEIGSHFPAQRSGITLHAGELTLGLVPPEHLGWHIEAAIQVAGAKRIGHGIDIAYAQDMEALLQTMADQQILVEINLTSNDVILEVADADHPLPVYLRHGVPVALSTDDEGVSRIDLTHEYQRAVTTYDLDYEVLRGMSRNALQYSFLPGEGLFQDTLSGRAVDACSTATLGAEDVSKQCAAFWLIILRRYCSGNWRTALPHLSRAFKGGLVGNFGRVDSAAWSRLSIRSIDALPVFCGFPACALEFPPTKGLPLSVDKPATHRSRTGSTPARGLSGCVQVCKGTATRTCSGMFNFRRSCILSMIEMMVRPVSYTSSTMRTRSSA